MRPHRPLPILAIALALSNVICWVLVARHLQQPMLAAQKSAALLQYGALDGAGLARGEWWRLVASQFLHVHVMHMLFNVCAILVLGAAIERHAGILMLALVYLIGGSVGQYFSVVLHPDLVSSGASQAMLALCGFALVGCRRFSIARHAMMFAGVIVAIQFALDIYVSAAIKPGHSFGFAAGMLMALAAVAVRRAASTRPAAEVLRQPLN